MPTKPFPLGTKVTGRVDYTVEFATTDLAAACKCFRTLFPNGRIEKIGDRDFVAQCENCDKPIFDGDEYSPSGDCYLCKECAAAEAEEERSILCSGFETSEE